MRDIRWDLEKFRDFHGYLYTVNNGTMDVEGFIDSLYGAERPYLVLDDPFVNLDDTRLAAMMSLLQVYAEDAQVIVMTCCDREYDACADKTKIHLIEIKH